MQLPIGRVANEQIVVPKLGTFSYGVWFSFTSPLSVPLEDGLASPFDDAELSQTLAALPSLSSGTLPPTSPPPLPPHPRPPAPRTFSRQSAQNGRDRSKDYIRPKPNAVKTGDADAAVFTPSDPSSAPSASVVDGCREVELGTLLLPNSSFIVDNAMESPLLGNDPSLSAENLVIGDGDDDERVTYLLLPPGFTLV